jgi:DNA-binding NtrC family response regulator
MAASKTPILLVDDEPNVRLMYRSSLAGLGYELFEAATGEAALTHFRERSFDVALLDLRLPDMSGLELLGKCRDLGVETPAAFITAFGEVPDALHALELGAIDFLPKPPTPEQLRNLVSDILLRHSADASKGRGTRDFEFFLRSAKRAINLRNFPLASENLIKALDLDPASKQAINLAGVMLEMREEHEAGGHSRRSLPK